MEQTLSEIFESVKAKMEEAGEYSREAYRMFIEEAIDDFARSGVLTDDDDIEMMEEKLMLRYREVIQDMSEDD